MNAMVLERVFGQDMLMEKKVLKTYIKTPFKPDIGCDRMNGLNRARLIVWHKDDTLGTTNQIAFRDDPVSAVFDNR